MAARQLRAALYASVVAFSAIAAPAMAETIFTPTSDGFAGSVRATASEQGAPIVAGSTVTVAGTGLIPGQTLTLMRGATVLNADPITVDAEGAFSMELTVDDEAATGLQPVVVIAENPAAATVVDLKISPEIEISGEDKFTILSEPVTRGLYQVAYSKAADALYVTAAVGRPPVKESVLAKVDPETLAIEAQINPAAAPAREDGSDGGVLAVYGVAVDDANGNVWVTNTRQDTVAVYKQSDLSLVKQFDVNAADHARDVVVDPATGRAYVSAAFTGNIEVFDLKTLEKLDPIVITSAKRGEDFGLMSLELDSGNGKLFTVSMSSNEAAIVDLVSGESKLIDLPGARSASGVSYDAADNLIFVASQQSDNLLIVNAETGETMHDIEVGAGALNVAFDPVHRLAYVANRGSGTITVVDTEGTIVANLDAGTMPNQLRADGNGNVYAVNKSRGENDPEGDRVWRITPTAN